MKLNEVTNLAHPPVASELTCWGRNGGQGLEIVVISRRGEAVGKISVDGEGGRRSAEGSSSLDEFCRFQRYLLRRVAMMRLNLHARAFVQWRPSWQLPVASTAGVNTSSHHCHVHRTICHHAQHSPVRAHIPNVMPTVPLVQQQRGAKTKSTVKLKDLPQGVVKLEAYDDGVDEAPRYPTVVQGHRNNMQKFKNCVVLTRVGGFYEVCTAFLS